MGYLIYYNMPMDSAHFKACDELEYTIEYLKFLNLFILEKLL